MSATSLFVFVFHKKFSVIIFVTSYSLLQRIMNNNYSFEDYSLNIEPRLCYIINMSDFFHIFSVVSILPAVNENLKIQINLSG